jgi:hypothetical protein
VKRHEDAIAWSHMAIANGLYEGQGAQFARISFRNPTALYEGPFDILRHAHKALGDDAAAARAEKKYEAAQRARAKAKG